MLGLPSAPGMSRGQRRCAAVPSCPSGLTLPLALGSAWRLCPYRLQQRRSPSDPLPVGSANGGPRGACRDGEREVGCLMLVSLSSGAPQVTAQRGGPLHSTLGPPAPSVTVSIAPGPCTGAWGSPISCTGLWTQLPSNRSLRVRLLLPASPCLQQTPVEGGQAPPLPLPHPETVVHVCPGGPRTRLREGTHREAIHAAEQKQGLRPEPSSEAQGLLFQLYFIFS